MTKKPSSKKNQNHDLVNDVLTASTVGEGVTVYLDRISSGMGTSLASPELRIPVSIASDIRDLKQGRTETIEIWGPTPNLDFVGTCLAEPEVREHVMRFFLSRRVEPLLLSLIPTAFMRPEEAAFTKAQFYVGLNSATNNEAVSRVVMELLCGPLTSIGVMSDNGAYSYQVRFPFKRVTTFDLAVEVNVQQIEAGLRSVELAAIKPHDRQSKQTFAERFSDSVMRIGSKLMDSAELHSVIDDIIAGVRANLMPSVIADRATDVVPSVWKNNPQILLLTTCLPFVRAAMLKPSSARLVLQNETRILEEWVSIIVNYLRDSKRYQWVSRNDMLRNYTSMKLRDVKGVPRSLVVYREMKVIPVAQSVIAIEDAASEDLGAIHIMATKDRLAAVVQGSYGDAEFRISDAARIYADIARDLIGMGFEDADQAVLMDAVGDGSTLADIAALLSTRLEVEISADGTVIESAETEHARNDNDGFEEARDWDPRWWFTMDTTEKNFDVRHGIHSGDRVCTVSAVEALMAHADFDAVDAYPEQPQLLGPAAFGTKLIGFDASALLTLDRKFKFQVEFSGQTVSAAMRAQDFATLRSGHLAALVQPYCNAAIIRSISDIYAEASNLVIAAAGSKGAHEHWLTGHVPSEMIISSLAKRICMRLLELAQDLSATFRKDVLDAVTQRVIANSSLTGDDLAVFRAQLVQDAFVARCDLIALQFFLFIQGVECPSWNALIETSTMEEICTTRGRKRTDVR